MDNQHLLSTDVPQKFHDHNTNTDKRLPVRKSRFSELQKALMFCYHKLKRGEWSSAEGSIYLSMYGINNKLQSSIIINGENEFNLAQILQLPNYENSSDYLKLLDDRTLNPNMFGTPSIPPSWDIPNGISSYIDAPMHLIFLGCVKFMNKRILDWSALFKKETKLVKTFAPVIPSIYDLKLEWCKIFPLSSGGSFSGFVSENWLAVARLSRWMYSSLSWLLIDGSFDLTEPKTDVYKWNGVELRKWLALRGLPRKGLVHELKQTVHDYLSNPETIPPISSRYTCSIELVTDSIICMQAFIQRIMQNVYTEELINETENYIKLFLTSLNEWDNKSKPKDSKPVWLMSYSLLNLLNFPEMMKTYGPVRNLWEGGSMDEGILRLIKPNITKAQNN